MSTTEEQTTHDPQFVVSESTRNTGCVKWFNNKAGYGFVTVKVEGEDQDVFVHHSEVMTATEQYKYLVQGEYVQFVMTEANSDGHEWQASEVRGVDGGKLMCETRNELRNSRGGEEDQGQDVRRSRNSQGGHGRSDGDQEFGGPPRYRGAGPRDGDEFGDNGCEWALVKRSRRPPQRNNDRPRHRVHTHGEES